MMASSQDDNTAVTITVTIVRDVTSAADATQGKHIQ